MDRDYPVKERSDAQVKESAKRLRLRFAKLESGRVDVIATLAQKTIPTCYGEKRLIFKDYPGNSLEEEGKTEFFIGAVEISLSSATYERLSFGDGRARNTASHEIGHACLHEGPPMFRDSTAARLRSIPPYRSAEHQAKVFAPAFLIDDDTAIKLGDAEEIAVTFGVSLESAQIYLRELRRPEERARVGLLFQELRQKLSDFDEKRQPIRFLRELCPKCGNARLFPVGPKFMCQACNGVFDRFQDGDTLGS